MRTVGTLGMGGSCHMHAQVASFSAFLRDERMVFEKLFPLEGYQVSLKYLVNLEYGTI